MTTTKLDILKHAVMDLTTEDSYGLYEVVWRANTLFGDLSEGARLELARGAVSALASQGWLDIMVIRQDEAGELTVDDIFQSDDSWKPFGANDPGFEIIASDEGRRIYFSGNCCPDSLHAEFRAMTKMEKKDSAGSKK